MTLSPSRTLAQRFGSPLPLNVLPLSNGILKMKLHMRTYILLLHLSFCKRILLIMTIACLHYALLYIAFSFCFDN